MGSGGKLHNHRLNGYHPITGLPAGLALRMWSSLSREVSNVLIKFRVGFSRQIEAVR